MSVSSLPGTRSPATGAFAHLRCRTSHSLGDSIIRIPELVKRARELGVTAVAITDDGNLCAAVEFERFARRAGIKPIFGLQIWVRTAARHETSARHYGSSSIDVTLLAQDQTGYRNLVRLSSLSAGSPDDPPADLEWSRLETHSDGLQALVGGAHSYVTQWLRRDERSRAIQVTRDFQSIFGDRLSLTVDCPTSGCARLDLERTADLGKRVGVPLVATADVRYLHRGDARAYHVYRRLTGRGAESCDEQEATEAHWLPSAAEMTSAFASHPEAVTRAIQIASQSDLNLGPLKSADRAGQRARIQSGTNEAAIVRSRPCVVPEIAHFSTISRYRSRPLVSLVGSLLGLPEHLVIAVLRSVSTWMRPSIGHIFRENTELQSLYHRNEGVRRLLDVIARLDHTVRERFVGSGDLVLSETALIDLMPTFGQWQHDDWNALQWTRHDLQWLGFEPLSLGMTSRI